MKNDTSTIGDWAFLIGGIGLVGGYLAYDNIGQINAWLTSMQQPAPASVNPSGSVLVWLAANWGIVVLVAAIVFAAVKMRSGSGSTGTSEGATTKHKRLNHVKVNLI